MTTLLSSCCRSTYHVYEGAWCFVCDKCGKPCDGWSWSDWFLIDCLDCGTPGCDGKCTAHNDKLMTRQCCDCAHVTEEMVEMANAIISSGKEGNYKWTLIYAGMLAELILETKKKEGE